MCTECGIDVPTPARKPKGGGKGDGGGGKSDRFSPYGMGMAGKAGGGKDGGKGKKGGGGKGKNSELNNYPAEQKVWVGGIPEGDHEEELKQLLEASGGTC